MHLSMDLEDSLALENVLGQNMQYALYVHMSTVTWNCHMSSHGTVPTKAASESRDGS